MLAQPPVWLIIVAFLGAIGPLIVFHELGHYWVGRLFGVGAEQFSIGFGKEVTGWTDRRGTRWRLAWLPLGGYVKFVGDTDPSSLGSEEPGPNAAQGHSFASRPPWQRFLIVLAGPMANFLLAILIFAAFFAAFGTPRTSSEVTQVMPGSAAAQAGIQPGDRITAIAGRPTDRFEDIVNVVFLRPGEKVRIDMVRAGEALSVQTTLGATTKTDEFGQSFRIGQLGVLGNPRAFEAVPIHQLPGEAASYTWKMTRMMVDGLVQIVTGRRSIQEIGGPLKMAQIAGQRASLGMLEFVSLIAFFSINLGFINLLPVPMLDGGHLVFTAIEAVRRKPVSERTMEWAFRGGLAMLLALLLVATANDLVSFGLWEGVGRLIG